MAWKQELISNPVEYIEELNASITETDHPLNSSDHSKWNTYFKDNLLFHDIENDIHRTFPDLHFFQIGNSECYDGFKGVENEHYLAMRRILFVYAKLNTAISYVQGMNEIIAPIYYLFANDPDPEWKKHAESDSFFCFTNLMSLIRDNFLKDLDSTDKGIQYHMTLFSNLLLDIDRELWIYLDEKQLSPPYYCFRWITLLLSQEFDLPNVLRLWDSIFSIPDENRLEFTRYLCVAMLKVYRDKLLKLEFSEAIHLLQNYPPCDVTVILTEVQRLKETIKKDPH
jgi:hypothetical protein